MRILDNSTAQPRPARPRRSPSANYATLRRESYTKPYGMILVTGPTGSGKSTTLYATLNIVSQPGDQRHHGRGPGRVPAARHQPGAGQPEGRADVRRRRCARSCGPTRTSSLIGEIRDHETAQIAVEAALTGHLVLSTLHTNDAPSAITRLTEMGIEPFLVGSALDCVVAQRLARRLCQQVQGAVHARRRRSCCAARFPWLPAASRCRSSSARSAASACSKTGYRAGSRCTR